MIEQAVRSIMVNDAGLSALIEDRCYQETVPAEVSGDAVTFSITTASPTTAHNGDAGLDFVRMQIDCWSDTRAGVISLWNATRMALQDFSGVIDGETIQAVILAAFRDIPQPAETAVNVHRKNSEWLVIHVRN